MSSDEEDTTADQEPAEAQPPKRKRGRPPGVRNVSPSSVLGVADYPLHWGSIPEKAPIEEEADWVHTNWSVCRQLNHEGAAKCVLHRALTNPPSMGAIAMLQAAVLDFKKFEFDVYPKIKKGALDDAPESARRERMRIDEMLAIIERFKEEPEAES